ncbi:hypothetical protein KIPB_017357, partial [Kipferlia bialata]
EVVPVDIPQDNTLVHLDLDLEESKEGELPPIERVERVERFAYLDGLRGLAALIVLFYHYNYRQALWPPMTA